MLLAGGTLGPMFPNFIAFFMSLVPPQMRGRAGGLFTIAVFGGQFLSPLISAPLIAIFGLAQGMLAVAVIPFASAVFIGLRGWSQPPRAAEV